MMNLLWQHFNKYKRIYGFLLVCAVVGGFKLIQYSIEQKEQEPKLVILDEVTDTHELIPQDEEFSVYNTNSEYIGKRFRLTCKQPERRKKNEYGSVYYSVQDIRDEDYGSLLSKPREFVLVTEEAFSKDPYIELECLVCGYYHEHYTDITSNIVQKYYPVLRVLKTVRSGDSIMDFISPVQSVDKPKLSVTADKVTLTVDKVEYRGNINRIFFTLNNKSGSTIYQSGLQVKCGSDTISGMCIGSTYVKAAGVEAFYDEADETLLPMRIDPGSSSGVQVFAPTDGSKPLTITLKICASPKEVADNKIVIGKTKELELTYQPPKQTSTEPATETGTASEAAEDTIATEEK